MFLYDTGPESPDASGPDRVQAGSVISGHRETSSYRLGPVFVRIEILLQQIGEKE